MNELDKNQITIHERLSVIETKISGLETVMENIRSNHLPSIYEQLNNINSKLNSRPTWTVSLIITFLVTLSTGLIIYLFQ